MSTEETESVSHQEQFLSTKCTSTIKFATSGNAYELVALSVSHMSVYENSGLIFAKFSRNMTIP